MCKRMEWPKNEIGRSEIDGDGRLLQNYVPLTRCTQVVVAVAHISAFEIKMKDGMWIEIRRYRPSLLSLSSRNSKYVGIGISV